MIPFLAAVTVVVSACSGSTASDEPTADQTRKTATAASMEAAAQAEKALDEPTGDSVLDAIEKDMDAFDAEMNQLEGSQP